MKTRSRKERKGRNGRKGPEAEGLQVTGHRVVLSPRAHGEQEMEEEDGGSEDEAEDQKNS